MAGAGRVDSPPHPSGPGRSTIVSQANGRAVRRSVGGQRRLKDQSISNSATTAPSFWVPTERALNTTGSPERTAFSMAAFMLAPSAKVHVDSCVAFLVHFAVRPVTSEETFAPDCSMK